MISGGAVQTSIRGGEPDGLSTRGSASRPFTSRVEANHANNKLLEDLRELQTKDRQQKNKIGSLHKTMEQLKSDLKIKEEECVSIQTKFEAMEEHYRKLYEDEKASHSKTKENLATTQQHLEDKRNLVEELKLRHEQKITEINDAFEARFQTMQEEKDKEISEREERISKLKNQMAEILKGNSWERQQQLEELSKELTKVSEETNMLRMKLKSRKKEKCEKCDKLQAELDEKNKILTEKEALVSQLKAVCGQFETQLKQQDIIMKQFAESKGQKVNYNP